MSNYHNVPCQICGKLRKFRLIKHSNLYKNFRTLCRVCTPKNRKHITKNYFTDIDNEIKAYAFGFFWADGCINTHKSFTVRLQNCDENILKKFFEYFGGSLHNRAFKDKRSNKIYEQKEWIIHDVVFIQSLLNVGFRKTIEKIPSNLLNHFLRGLIDGDGSYVLSKRNKIETITISSFFEDDFKHVKEITKFVKSVIYKKIQKEKSKSVVLSFLGKQEEKIKLLNWIYKDATIFLERKFNKIQHLLTI